MQELGEEFGEDLENAKFHLEKMPGLMSSDDLFAAEEQVIAAAQQLLDNGRFADRADGKLYRGAAQGLSEAVPHHAPADEAQRP